MVRTAASGAEHDRLILEAFAALTAHNCEDIRVDHLQETNPKFEHVLRPELFNGKRPDLTGIYQGRLWMVECETCDSCDNDEAKEQYSAFSDYAHDHDTKLIVSVPRRCGFRVSVTLLRTGIKKSVEPGDGGIDLDVWS